MPADRSNTAFWTALAALVSAFALSQAFRTVITLVALPLRDEFGFAEDTIGIVGGAFHLAFGLMQFPVGIMLDRYGPRRTILVLFPAAIAGSIITATGSSMSTLLVGQWLIGIGCAPGFLAPLILIGRSRAPGDFSRLSGLVLGVGGSGMLLTGTPLAWVVEQFSWRASFWLLGAAAGAAWLWCWVAVPRLATATTDSAEPRSDLGDTLREIGTILANRHMLGMLALGSVTYASFISLRGLWLVPLMADRHGYSLVAAGNVALVASILALLGPPIAGRLDPGGNSRRRVLAGCTLAYAVLFVLLAVGTTALADAGLVLLVALGSGYMVLHYSEVREVWPAAMAGRALALINSAMFLGVAAMQWASGVAAAEAERLGLEPVGAAFWAIAALLLAGTTGYLGLRPARQ